MNLHPEIIKKWFEDNGDYTHNLNYPLNENSNVIEIGGYIGVWSQQIIDKFNCNVFIVEPIEEFFQVLKQKFKKNNKVTLLKSAVSSENKKGIIYHNGDGSSSILNNENPNEVDFITIDNMLDMFKLNNVDLIQINIEGEEYTLLEHMIKTGTINFFKNIQIQFHLGITDDVLRRENIRNELIKNGFEINFDYPFVWESWYKQ
jgi:FkbM family methyltransferase